MASLSLMLVDNHSNMLKEAFRVCQPGAALGFTIWGRKECNLNFEIMDAVWEKHNLKPKVPPAKTAYDLGKDQEALKQEMLQVGFTKIRMWFQHNNFNFKDG